jgi:hypothetical protein
MPWEPSKVETLIAVAENSPRAERSALHAPPLSEISDFWGAGVTRGRPGGIL